MLPVIVESKQDVQKLALSQVLQLFIHFLQTPASLYSPSAQSRGPCTHFPLSN